MSRRDFRVRFGEHVAELRSDAGLSQEQLAARAKVSRHYISEVEAGKRNPSLEILIKMASGLAISLGELVDF